eukprot:g3471.t1
MASVALVGAQRIAVISSILIGIVLTFSDSMPRPFVKNIWSGFALILLWTFLIIVALKQLPHDPKLDLHIPILGTYSWTGVAINALLNYIIMVTKLLVVSLWKPKNFVTLKVPLQSNKMMENRADMILVTAEKEKLYKTIGKEAQKLITAIVGSTADVPWELAEQTSKSVIFTRLRMDERYQRTSEFEFKLEFYTKLNIEQTYRCLHDSKDWTTIYKETTDKINMSRALPSLKILYRRVHLPFPGVSDRLLCVKSVCRYYPDYGFAYVVSQDAEQKYLNQIPKTTVEGTVRMRVRLAGWIIEKVDSAQPMTKLTYFVSSNIGGSLPVRIRNYALFRESRRLEKEWDDNEWYGEEPALFSREEVIENTAHENAGLVKTLFPSPTKTNNPRNSSIRHLLGKGGADYEI